MDAILPDIKKQSNNVRKTNQKDKVIHYLNVQSLNYSKTNQATITYFQHKVRHYFQKNQPTLVVVLKMRSLSLLTKQIVSVDGLYLGDINQVGSSHQV